MRRYAVSCNIPPSIYLGEHCELTRGRGNSLALCEIYLTVAAISFRVLHRMQLYESSVRDIKYDHDLMVPQPQRGSKGIRILIR